MKYLLLVVFLLGGCADDAHRECQRDAAQGAQALSEARAENQALRDDWDRMKRLVTRLRASKQPSMVASVGVVAVVESVGRLLAQYGIKGSRWEILKKVLVLTGVEAELKASLKQQTEDLDNELVH